MDHYREGLHRRMEARAERLRATFREFASATDEFELREWDANGLNSRLMRLNDVCEDTPHDSNELRGALNALWDTANSAARLVAAFDALEDMV
eukprot:7385831-Prymnesium_polylepis.1